MAGNYSCIMFQYGIMYESL